jgi:hypothetical protein
MSDVNSRSVMDSVVCWLQLPHKRKGGVEAVMSARTRTRLKITCEKNIPVDLQKIKPAPFIRRLFHACDPDER